MTTTLQERAMLATLTISVWPNRRYDRNVSNEIEKMHSAHDAGRYNKMLVDKSWLEPCNRIGAAARTTHYKMTLPWGDNGDRLLPGTMFMDYTKAMRDYKSRFETEVDTFCTKYPELVRDARTRLGSMYDPTDYPTASEIRSKFGIETGFSPVAAANDFRVQLNEEFVQAIQQEIVERTQRRQDEAVKHCFDRIRDVVGKIHTSLADKDKVFRDSLIENARELVSFLPALNVTGNPDLAKAHAEIQELLVPPERLRRDKHLRSKTADRAAEILSRLEGYA